VGRERGQWQLKHLAPICDALTGEWRARYQDLLEEHGPPPEPPLHERVTWVGPTSPKTTEVLQQMSLTELVTFLKEWEPPQEWFSPSREGLGRALTTNVEANPIPYASDAELFKELDPTYVRSIILGLSEACGAEKEFDWNPVLNLCSWIVTQPRELKVEKRRREEGDPHWGWARKAVAGFISNGFRDSPNGIPFTYRTIVWEILEPLTEDPDPTPQDENQDEGAPLDPANLAINTVRGETMHSVVHYALWCRRNLLVQEAETIERQAMFKVLPKVCTVLEQHLDQAADPSPAIRSVYGQWLPWLILLDREWVISNLKRIFPKEVELRRFRDAAWETYVRFCSVYNDAVPLLMSEYKYAVENITGRKREHLGVGDPEEKLAEHLMVMYWRGMVSFDDPEGPFCKFWDKATRKLKAHALSFIGRSIETTRGEVDLDIIDKFKALWAIRVQMAQGVERLQESEEEMSAFGWWFVSGKFDTDWAFEQLQTALDLSGGKIHADHTVIKRLADYSDIFPLQAVTCLEKIIKRDSEGWGIRIRLDSVKTVLATSIGSGDAEAKNKAQSLINTLGARGFFEFRELLF